MAKTSPMGVRLDPELKEHLDRAARADRRSTSSLIHKILEEWAAAHPIASGNTTSYEGI